MAVEDHDTLGAISRDLAAEFGSDRPGSPRDYDASATQERCGLRGRDPDRHPPQEILQGDLAHLCEDEAPVDEVTQAREDSRADLRLAAQLRDAPYQRRAGRRDRHQDLADLVGCDDLGDARDGTEDGHAADAHSLLLRVVVDEADERSATPLPDLEFLHEPDSSGTRAHDERYAVDAMRLGLHRTVLAKETNRNPATRNERRAEQEVGQEDRAGKTHSPLRKHDRCKEQPGADEIRLQNGFRVAHAHVAPPTREQAEHPEARQLADTEKRKSLERQIHVTLRNDEIEPQRERGEVGYGREQDVEKYRGTDSVPHEEGRQ